MTLSIDLTPQTDNPGKKWGSDWPNTYGGSLSFLSLKLIIEVILFGSLFYLAQSYEVEAFRYVSHFMIVVYCVGGLWSLGLLRLVLRILSRSRRVIRSRNTSSAWQKEWPLSSFSVLPNQKLQPGALLLPFIALAFLGVLVASQQHWTFYIIGLGVFLVLLYLNFEFVSKNLFVPNAEMKIAEYPTTRDGHLSLVWKTQKDLSAFEEITVTLRCCREKMKDVATDLHLQDDDSHTRQRKGATKTIRHKRIVWEVKDQLSRAPQRGEAVHIKMDFPVYRGGVLAGVDTVFDGDTADYWELEMGAKEKASSSPWCFVHLVPIAGRSQVRTKKAASKEIDRPVKKEVRAGDCPRCDVPLGQNQCCETCHGQLVSGPDLPRFLPPELADLDRVKALVHEFGSPSFSCPQCGQAMKHTPLKGQSVEVCLGCGSGWFDANELAKVRGGSSFVE